jgi:hypothetical protein
LGLSVAGSGFGVAGLGCFVDPSSGFPVCVGLLLASFLVFVVSLPRLALVWLVLVLVLALVI